jgi:hypothetical protein
LESERKQAAVEGLSDAKLSRESKRAIIIKTIIMNIKQSRYKDTRGIYQKNFKK